MQRYKAWPFQEARQIIDRRPLKDGQPVLFETGFGPSGLPHIGTFAEVARTTWVRQAFAHLRGRPTRLLAFSDDMDGLRKGRSTCPKATCCKSTWANLCTPFRILLGAATVSAVI